MKEKVVDTGIFSKTLKIAESDEDRRTLSTAKLFDYIFCKEDLEKDTKELRQRMKAWRVTPDENGYVTKWNPKWPIAEDLAECWNKLQDALNLIKPQEPESLFEMLVRGIEIGKLLKQIEVRKFEQDVIKRKNQLRPLEVYNDARDKSSHEKRDLAIQIFRDAKRRNPQARISHVLAKIEMKTGLGRSRVYKILEEINR